MFCVSTKTQSRRLQNSSGLKNIFERLRFRDGLEWTVGLAAEIKLHFYVFPSQCGRGLDLFFPISSPANVLYLFNSH